MKIKIETDQLIEAVRQRPTLWDKRNKYYNSRSEKTKLARQRAWLEVLKELVPSYDTLNEELKKDLEAKVQQRWRTARDSYKKDKLAEANNQDRKKYAYFDKLSFLEVNLSYVPTAHSENKEDNEVQSEDSNAANTDTTPVVPKPKTRQDSAVKNKTHPKNDIQLESEDLAFFQSLQPTLKRLNRYQKLMFRSKVLNIVMEMEKSMEQKESSEAIASSSNLTAGFEISTVQSVESFSCDPPQYMYVNVDNKLFVKNEIEFDSDDETE